MRALHVLDAEYVHLAPAAAKLIDSEGISVASLREFIDRNMVEATTVLNKCNVMVSGGPG